MNAICIKEVVIFAEKNLYPCTRKKSLSPTIVPIVGGATNGTAPMPPWTLILIDHSLSNSENYRRKFRE
jgi:hypothetical protein